MNVPDSTLIQGMVLVGFGAAIGFLPSYFAARTQAGFQRRQFLFDKKLTALLDFSKIIINGTTILHQFSIFEQEIKTVIDDNDMKRALTKMIDLEHTADHWFIEISAHLTIIRALFNTDVPTLRLSEIVEANATVSQQLKPEEFQPQATAKVKTIILRTHELMESMQEFIIRLAKQLT